MELLTIAAIAKQIEVPESTARYYRDRFEAYIPSVGEGRSRRYLPEAVEVLRFIADCMQANMPADQIETLLAARFPINVTPQQQGATTQQQSAAVIYEMFAGTFAELMETQGKALLVAMQEVIERDRTEQLEAFSRLLEEQRQAHDEQMEAVLRELTEARQQIATSNNRAEKRDRDVMEAIRALQELKQQPKGLLGRLFGK